MFPPAFVLLGCVVIILFWCDSSKHFAAMGQKILDFFKQFKEDDSLK